MKDMAISFTIRPAKGAQDMETVKILIREYLAFLGADLTFQNVEAELSGLPGKYAAPEGALFLAWAREVSDRETAAGCVALRKLGRGRCEMKRLFVRPEYWATSACGWIPWSVWGMR